MNKIAFLPIAMSALLFAGCSDEKAGKDPVEPATGQDVVFTSTGDMSRTEYQPEQNGKFPIVWLPGDQMLVMSPQCASTQGQYEVGTTVSATGSASAGTLQKIGEAGVQWGSNPQGDFFSVYPYKKVEAVNPENNTVTMRMPHIQNDYIQNNNGSYTAKADMDASFLYAQTFGVDNGKSVDLGYKSLSSAIRFTLVGPQADNAQNTFIQSITITSAGGRKIAGKMDVTFTKDGEVPTVTMDDTDSYDQILVYSSYQGATGGGYLTLKKGEKIELNAFVMLDQDTDIAGWTVEVKTLTKTYTLALKGGDNGTMKRGMIHRLGNLPALEADESSAWKVENWIANIPRNTYLCEISVPGSWNSLNGDFQQGVDNATDLTAQYNIGVRAFHLDTRWKSDATTLGVAAGGSRDATGDLWEGDGGILGLASKGKYTTGSALTDVLTTIKGNLKADEFMYVICTFAQGSATPASGKTWGSAVSAAIAGDNSYFDGKSITAQTTVKDVLGKIIVICNSEGAVPTNLADSRSLFVNAPLTLKSAIFSATPPYNEDKLYFGDGKASPVTMLVSQCQTQWNDNRSQGSDTSERGYLPSQTQRRNQLNAILKWSQDNYKGGGAAPSSDKLILLGIGGMTGHYGSLTGNYTGDKNPGVIAQQYDPWIYGKIEEMKNQTTNYYPVGIVLMNNVVSTDPVGTYGSTSLTGPVVVKQILMLNDLYRKAFDESQPAWPDKTTNSPANYSASHANGGNAWTVQ